MKYYLAEACKNTFVLFEALFHEELSEDYLKEAHDILIYEGRDDALILKNGRSKKGSLYVDMVVLGVDGEFGEFCGNGSRAIAAFLFEYYPMFQRYFLVTKRSSHQVYRVGEKQFCVRIPRPKTKMNQQFVTSDRLGEMKYIEVIEPHLILEAKMSDQELFFLGRKLNASRDLFPHGININAYQILREGVLKVKTYERGVQRLTRACGSGSTACAFHYRPQGATKVVTSGGVIDVISSRKEIELIGPACVEEKEKQWRQG